MPVRKSVSPPARKRWGQTFLIDPNMIRKIVDTIDPRPDDRFLEIGPGHGELTLPLAERARAVTAVDIDPWLVDDLKKLVPANVSIIQGDILDADLAHLLPAGSRVYGSLPYYISSPIIFRLLDHRRLWRDAHFILQKEVGQRLIAGPGSKVYGRLSVMVQAFARVEPFFDLPPTVFRPEPKVDSTLLSLRPLSETGTIADHRLFTQVVRLAFGQRRKKLSNALKALDAGELLAEMGLADLRAERVSVPDYIRLANRLAAHSEPGTLSDSSANYRTDPDNSELIE